MPDNPFVAPRPPLALLADVPDSLRRRVKQYSGRLATDAVQAMQERLPFFAQLEASQRASVQLVVQTAVVNFAEWLQDPESNVGYTAEAFALVPQDLTRRIALRQTVDMVRVSMEFFEEVVPMLARNDEQAIMLTVGILRYSRNLAFAAAKAYADAAEARDATRLHDPPVQPAVDVERDVPGLVAAEPRAAIAHLGEPQSAARAIAGRQFPLRLDGYGR